MKLSIFTTITNPKERQDPIDEALPCYSDLADEVIVIDGAETDKDRSSNLLGLTNVKWINTKETFWPKDFDWKFIGEQFQRGYEACTGDWVIHADIDYFFHENDFEQIRKVLEARSEHPALSFWKYQFILVDRYRLKSRVVIAVNKGKFGDRIKFNGGGDLCQPMLDGKLLNSDKIPEARIPFYNYDFCFKTREVIEKDWKRFRKAYLEQFDKDFGEAVAMLKGRYNNGKGWKEIAVSEHPKYIQEKIRNITPDQSGFDVFGNVKRS